jgi:hypothetical protein
VRAAIATLVADAREGWSPPDWYRARGGTGEATGPA